MWAPGRAGGRGSMNGEGVKGADGWTKVAGYTGPVPGDEEGRVALVDALGLGSPGNLDPVLDSICKLACTLLNVPVSGAALFPCAVRPCRGAGRGGSASLLAVQETGRASGLLSRPRRICTALLFAAVPSAEARLSGRFVAAVVSIINKDETYSKGVFGEVAFRKPRGNTFCNATLLPKQPVVLVVEDALSDERHGPSGLHGSFGHVAKSGEGQWALQQAHAMWLSGSRTSPRSKRPRTLCDSMPELR